MLNKNIKNKTMKNLMMLSGMMLLVASSVFGQVGETWYYKYVETVDDETGVRRKDPSEEGKEFYITFTKNSSYESDEKGRILEKSTWIFQYQGEQNEMFVYVYAFNNINSYSYHFFSKDYKRMNSRMFYGKYDGSWFEPARTKEEWSKNIYVYERTDPPKKAKAPDRLY